MAKDEVKACGSNKPTSTGNNPIRMASNTEENIMMSFLVGF
jgi:hypothetical protein